MLQGRTQAISPARARRTSASGSSAPHRGRPGELEEHQPRRPALGLLVPRESGPRRIWIDGDRLGREDVLHELLLVGKSRQPERGEQPERHRAAVRQPVARGSFQRVGERVPQVELHAWPPVMRVGEADPGLERGAGAHLLGSVRSHTRSPASSPVLTTSARPFTRSASGSVVSSAGSQTTRAGQWNAPTTFFAPLRSIAVFPPIPASTWPTSVVGTAVHGTPRMYVAAAKPATSVVEPPPSATIPPSRPIPSASQRRPSTALVFAASPAGTSCETTSREPSATWARTPWMPATCSSTTSSTGPVAGHQLLEAVERAELHVYSGSREEDPVDVVARASATAS